MTLTVNEMLAVSGTCILTCVALCSLHIVDLSRVAVTDWPVLCWQSYWSLTTVVLTIPLVTDQCCADNPTGHWPVRLSAQQHTIESCLSVCRLLQWSCLKWLKLIRRCIWWWSMPVEVRWSISVVVCSH